MEEILSKSTYGVRRAGLASVATMSLVTAAAVAGAGAASATTDFKFQRIGGADRYETSTLVADEFATANPDVILANGEPGNYADALSANTLAGEKNIPVLLTRKDKTPASVLAQLKEDGTKNITVVGGTSVVSDAQVAALKAAGYNVTRIAGSDRFAHQRGHHRRQRCCGRRHRPHRDRLQLPGRSCCRPGLVPGSPPRSEHQGQHRRRGCRGAQGCRCHQGPDLRWHRRCVAGCRGQAQGERHRHRGALRWYRPRRHLGPGRGVRGQEPRLHQHPRGCCFRLRQGLRR